MRQSRPATSGRVIMFVAVSVGWLILFLVNMVNYQPTARWWVLAIFSAAAAIAAAVVAVVLNRRRTRPPITLDSSGES